MTSTVAHLGIVRETGNNLVRVGIIQESACGSCHARGSCSLNGESDKIIDVVDLQPESYQVGENIRVIMERSMGMKALGLGYILPFFILLTVLIVLISFGADEGLAGIISIASLGPYYLVLSLFRKILGKKFSFRLEKL
jgi:sigma-E factor negative regulatory protein RseC